jgi:hypothetical protein
MENSVKTFMQRNELYRPSTCAEMKTNTGCAKNTFCKQSPTTLDNEKCDNHCEYEEHAWNALFKVFFGDRGDTHRKFLNELVS